MTTLSLSSVPRDPNVSDENLPSTTTLGAAAGTATRIAGTRVLGRRRGASETTSFFKKMMTAEKAAAGDGDDAHVTVGCSSSLPRSVSEEEEMTAAIASAAALSALDISDGPGGSQSGWPQARPPSELGEAAGGSSSSVGSTGRPNPTPPLPPLPHAVERAGSQSSSRGDSSRGGDSRGDSSAERPKGRVLTRGELDAVKAEAAEIEVREREAALSQHSSPRSATISPRSVDAAAAAAAAAVVGAVSEVTPPAAEPEPEPSRKKGGRMTQEEWDEIRRERLADTQEKDQRREAAPS